MCLTISVQGEQMLTSCLSLQVLVCLQILYKSHTLQPQFSDGLKILNFFTAFLDIIVKWWQCHFELSMSLSTCESSAILFLYFPYLKILPKTEEKQM